MILPPATGLKICDEEIYPSQRQAGQEQERGSEDEMRKKTKPVEGLERLFRRKACNTKLEGKSAEIEGIGEKWSLGVLRTDKRADGKTEILSSNTKLSNFELLSKEVSKIL